MTQITENIKVGYNDRCSSLTLHSSTYVSANFPKQRGYLIAPFTSCSQAQPIKYQNILSSPYTTQISYSVIPGHRVLLDLPNEGVAL